MADIEIGISINAKVYLHIVGNELTTPFEVSKILNVDERDGLTVVTYQQSSVDDCVSIIVDDDMKDIEKAMNDAVYYKDEALKRINELIK